MDFEKKYKNALEWARQVKDGRIGFVRSEVEKVFPELKESENERIRNSLIRYFQRKEDRINAKEAIAWLEKQGEPKTELATEDEIYWLAWAIGRLPDTEKADEAESVLKELFEKLKKMKGCEE